MSRDDDESWAYCKTCSHSMGEHAHKQCFGVCSDGEGVVSECACRNPDPVEVEITKVEFWIDGRVAV